MATPSPQPPKFFYGRDALPAAQRLPAVDEQYEISFFDSSRDIAMATNFCSSAWVLLAAGG